MSGCSTGIILQITEPIPVTGRYGEVEKVDVVVTEELRLVGIRLKEYIRLHCKATIAIGRLAQWQGA
jgi:hypothetical protein